MEPNPVIDIDVAIIGAGTAGTAGTAGMSAYRAALEHTPRVLLIEGGDYGTTCARVGCMPSKLLIAAADAAHAVARASRFGVSAGPVEIDGRAVMARVRSERDRFIGFVVDAVQHWPAEHKLVGHARFIDDHTLQVGATQVRAGCIVIATGSRPAVPGAWRAALGDRPVFIAGDVGEDRPLLHEAADEGRIAGGNAGRFPDVRVRPRRTSLAVVFSEPQIALAGASHAELTATGTAFETGRFPGAETLGPTAEHIGHLLAWSVQRGDTVQQMLGSPFYHP